MLKKKNIPRASNNIGYLAYIDAFIVILLGKKMKINLHNGEMCGKTVFPR